MSFEVAARPLFLINDLVNGARQSKVEENSGLPGTRIKKVT